jgi:cobalt-zinc-cadmium resistance protein CzcA
MVVYLPIFALTGVEGKMFHPMAFTVVMALLGAMILSVTFVPAAIAMFVTGKVKEEEGVVMRTARLRYEPVLQWVLGHRNIAFSAAVALVVLSGVLASRMGSEFIPSLSEGDFAMQAMRVPGTSLTQSVEMQQRLEKAVIAQVPEVERMFARSGTAEIASDPMPPNASDAYIMLKPQDQWPNPKKPRDELIAEVQKAAAGVPGSNYELSQPIQLRFNELISGVRSDVAVKVFGDDMDVLNNTANKIAAALKAVPGSSEVKVEQTSGLPVLTINIDREKAARYGLNIADVQNSIAIAVGGRQAGTLYEGDRRFDMVVRLPETDRRSGYVQLLIPVPANAAQGANQIGFIPLSQVANLDLQLGPNQISRENGKRLVIVSANVRGRDLGSFVEEPHHRTRRCKSLRATGRLGGPVRAAAVGSQAPADRCSSRLAAGHDLVVPDVQQPEGRHAGLHRYSIRTHRWCCGVVAAGHPTVDLGRCRLHCTVRRCSTERPGDDCLHPRAKEGRTLRQAVDEGALTRLRPVLMTALVASWASSRWLATGTGAEVQRPLATVVIGGILSSALTLLVLPALYHWAHRKDEGERGRSG